MLSTLTDMVERFENDPKRLPTIASAIKVLKAAKIEKLESESNNENVLYFAIYLIRP
jgi:hypothetical protein